MISLIVAYLLMNFFKNAASPDENCLVSQYWLKEASVFIHIKRINTYRIKSIEIGNELDEKR